MAATTLAEVRTVAVSVPDQDAAVDFYTNELGFEKRLDGDLGNGNRWIEVAPPGSHTTIALTKASPEAPAGADTGIRLTTSDADQEHGAMLSRGVSVDDVLRWPGVPAMFTFRDLANNTLYVVEQTA